jgi:Sigma 54 modulation protein / S30EA ribosomal protein
MSSILVSYRDHPVPDEAMAACQREIDRLERLHPRVVSYRATLSEIPHEKGPLYEVQVVADEPGGQVVVERRPPPSVGSETLEAAIQDAFERVRRRLGERRARLPDRA